MGLLGRFLSLCQDVGVLTKATYYCDCQLLAWFANKVISPEKYRCNAFECPYWLDSQL